MGFWSLTACKAGYLSSKGGPKKKGKLSKAERLRLLKEEEDQRLREKEEARLKAEQIEAEKLEKERLEKEERERLEAKELEHREEELTELDLLLKNKFAVAEEWKSELRAQAKWERYMKCDGSPDPTVLHEINTFISLWREVQNEDIQSVLCKSNLVINLIQELEFLLLDTPSHVLSENEVIQYKGTILDLQALLGNKCNEGTDHLLKQASVLADIDTGNMQTVIKDRNVTLYVWANLNKNPRFKGYEFLEEIGFELPKPLALSNIAIRILHTSYDHLSPQSSTFSLQVKKEIEETRHSINILEESSGEEMKPPEMENNTGVENIPTHDEEVQSESRKSAISFNSIAREAVNEGLQQTKSEIHPEEFAVSLHSLPLQSEQEEVIDDDVVDLRQFTPLGGVYYFDLLKLPPQRKQLKEWSILQLLEGGLQTFPYPMETLQTTTPRYEKEGEIITFPLVGVSFKLPEDVIFFEEPQVARWDPKGKNWRTDYITNKTYYIEDKKISFKMNSFYTFTLFQNAHINMPYLSWELRPEGMNAAMFTITSAFTDFQLEIKDNQCRLNCLSAEGYGSVSHILKNWMTPITLKTALKKAGLNLFPAEDSDKFVSIIKKNNQVEKAAYEQMALLSPCYCFSWSKWNAESGYENVVLKVKEFSKTEYKDDIWLLYMFNGCRAQRLKITESSEIFSDNIPENCEFHSSLFHAVKAHTNDTTVEDIKISHYKFIDCVYQLLESTKVLTYS
ncbi:dynein axonemal intermediate chain 7 isoform X2 [Microcaecilia unicolor]|uniref:Dynein axonemal intermediate chain 7 n=1 Tax=Microcaecilia unicolor TaxID=1415580 RepID=A0A6P7YZA0_9AMPH|nr:protein CASC1 isoform X2 [Microcaecilia unicolor]